MKDKKALLEAIFAVIFLGLILGWFKPPVSTVKSTALAESPAANQEIETAVKSEPSASNAEEASTPAQEVVQQSLGDVSGIYHVNVYTDQKGHYISDITITDLGSDIQVTASYKGFPINLTGVLTSERTNNKASWKFSINLSKLFQGSAAATIVTTKSGLFLRGFGSGTYISLEEGVGSGSAKGSGPRTSASAGSADGKEYLQGAESAATFAAPSTPRPKPSPIDTGAAAAASATGLAIAAGASARKRVRINNQGQIAQGGKK